MTLPDQEGEKDIPQNPRLATETPKGQEEGRGTLEMGPRTEDRRSPERSGHSDDRKRQVTILRDYVEVLRKEHVRLEAKLLNKHIHQVSVGGLHGSALEELREETQREYATLLRKELQPTLEYFELVNEELMEEIPLKDEDAPNFDYPAGYDWRESNYLHIGGGYEEQPPADTLIPPMIPAREEPRRTPEKKGMKGPSLLKRKGSSPGAFPNEKSQAEARQSAVEAVHRIMSSCSSLESSTKSEKGGMARGDWDPTYDGFPLDERGPQTITSPSEGRETQGP